MEKHLKWGPTLQTSATEWWWPRWWLRWWPRSHWALTGGLGTGIRQSTMNTTLVPKLPQGWLAILSFSYTTYINQKYHVNIKRFLLRGIFLCLFPAGVWSFLKLQGLVKCGLQPWHSKVNFTASNWVHNRIKTRQLNHQRTPPLKRNNFNNPKILQT